MSFDWKKTIGSVAPGIATMLGGPLAGMATSSLCKMFGIDATATDVEAQLATAVQKMTPEQAVEMKKVENNLIIELKKADVDIFKSEVDDKKSARKEHKDSYTPAILTYILVGGAIMLAYFVVTSSFAGMDKTLVGAVVGYVFSEVKQATSFWLGSSFGSQQKNAIMSDKLIGK